MLAYGQSDYVRQFGITVNTSNETIQGRVLNAPTLRYHASSRQPTIVSLLRAVLFSEGSLTLRVLCSNQETVHGICEWKNIVFRETTC